MKICFVILALLFSLANTGMLYAQYYSTYGMVVAGNRHCDVGRDSAHLNAPGGVFVDNAGNLYVSDIKNNRVQKWAPGAKHGVTAAGQKDTVSGSDSAHLYSPVGVFVDNKNNVYVADYGNNRVQKWAPGAKSGITVAGRSNGLSGTDSASLYYPWGVYVDTAGNVYVADNWNNRVQKWARGAKFGTTVAGQRSCAAGSDSAHLNHPENLTVDSKGNIYIADYVNNRVQKWVPGAKYGTTVAGQSNGTAGADSAHLTYPIGLWVDSFNNIWVSDRYNRVIKWSAGAKSGVTQIGLNIYAGKCDSSGIDGPDALCMDRHKALYVAEYNSNRVSKWAISGHSVTLYKTFDSLRRSFTVHFPMSFNIAHTYPLVFNFHGYTGTATQQEAYTRMDKVSDSFGFILVYPNGVKNQWNIGYNFVKYNSGVDDVGFVSSLIDTLSTIYKIDLKRVYACGWSDGGYFSYRLACQLSNRIAAVASVAGLMTDSMQYYCHSHCAVPVMHFHGTSDPEVNYNGGKGGHLAADSIVQYWVNKDSCPVKYTKTLVPVIDSTDSCQVEKYVYRYGKDSSEVVFFKIVNGGHTWPGGGFIATYLGHTNYDINAGVEMWNFFSTHTLKCGISTSIIPETGNRSFALYPNPCDNYVHIDLNNANTPFARLTVYDALQRVVYLSGIIGAGGINIATSALPNGLYFLKAETGRNIYVKAFVKMKD